jgi:hypothetical protein
MVSGSYKFERIYNRNDRSGGTKQACSLEIKYGDSLEYFYKTGVIDFGNGCILLVVLKQHSFPKRHRICTIALSTCY